MLNLQVETLKAQLREVQLDLAHKTTRVEELKAAPESRDQALKVKSSEFRELQSVLNIRNLALEAKTTEDTELRLLEQAANLLQPPDVSVSMVTQTSILSGVAKANNVVISLLDKLSVIRDIVTLIPATQPLQPQPQPQLQPTSAS